MINLFVLFFNFEKRKDFLHEEFLRNQKTSYWVVIHPKPMFCYDMFLLSSHFFLVKFILQTN